MAFFFSPPVRLIGATTLAGPHPGNAIARFYKANRVGINIFLMPGNIVTEVEPYSDLEAIRVFHGGHIHPVSAAEVALLTAAGFGANILSTPDAPPFGGIDIGTAGEGGATVDAVVLSGYTATYQGTYT